MNITITGNLGSGKTSVCKELKQAGFTIVSAGDIFRQIAEEKHMTVIELNEAAKSDRSIDDMLDQRSTQLGQQMDHTVFDSRLAWHFVPDSFKVFLLVDSKEAANRVYAGGGRSAEEYRDAQETEQGLRTRAKMEQERFAGLYGIDYYDGSNYDLIIESSCATPAQIAKEIIRNFNQYQTQPFPTKVELNIRRLCPTKKLSDIEQDRLAQCRAQERQEGGTLCAVCAPCIRMHEGCNYITDGHHGIFAAAAEGKVFARIQKIQAGGAQTPEAARFLQLSQEDFAQLAQELGFLYEDGGRHSGYTLDFSKI